MVSPIGCPGSREPTGVCAITTHTRSQADGASESVTASIIRSWAYYQGYGEGRRHTQWDLAARIFHIEPDLELVVETVYCSDSFRCPEAIAAIIWESLESGWRDEEAVASLREDLTREALQAMGGNYDLEVVSVMIDEHLRERERDEEAHREYHRRAEANERVMP